MDFEFGVMTKKWSMKATRLEVAKVAMALFIAKKIPIAIYKPRNYSFMPDETLFDLEMNDLMKRNVMKAHCSIKEII